MRIVALEEHVNIPEITGRIPQEAIAARGWPSPDNPVSPIRQVGPQLQEIGVERLQKMDESGITMQVLSVSGAGADLLAAIATFGIDRILFSVDYPFSTNAQGRAFLDSLDVPTGDLEKIAHGNAEKLLKFV